MLITTEHAFWVLEDFRRRQSRLVFGGRILGEEAACEAIVMHVWPDKLAIGIELLADDSKQSWNRLILLEDANFFQAWTGDPLFQQFATTQFNSILVIRFPDKTTMFLAEPTKHCDHEVFREN